MKLTPIEIKNQEFKKGMRGYDTVEVDSFLELVAEKYKEIIEQNERLAKQNLIYETELKNYRDVEKTLKQTLKNVQENSEISKQNSQKEAGLIVKEAELASAQLKERTRMQVLKMREEIVNLQNQKNAFISRLKHLLSSQLELIDVLETDDLDTQKLKDRTRNKSANASSVAVNRKVTSVPKKNIPKSPGPMTGSKKPLNKPAKTEGKDLFKDIFGENLDVDDFIK